MLLTERKPFKFYQTLISAKTQQSTFLGENAFTHISDKSTSMMQYHIFLLSAAIQNVRLTAHHIVNARLKSGHVILFSLKPDINEHKVENTVSIESTKSVILSLYQIRHFLITSVFTAALYSEVWSQHLNRTDFKMDRRFEHISFVFHFNKKLLL